MTLKNIPIQELFVHPLNPRKNIDTGSAEFAELTESIRANGLLQNLTVVPGHFDAAGAPLAGGYTIIMGHRRFAAAKAAGLTELPCMISDEQAAEKQIQLMLTENMMRKNITRAEEAEAFGQLRFDLGMSVDDIAAQSGFSASTVRHRLEIAKLDKTKLAKVEANKDRDFTLTDLIKLEEIEDIAERDAIVAKALGKPEFDMEVKKALGRQTLKSKLVQWRSVLPSFAIKIEKVDYSATEYVGGISVYSSNLPDLKVPDDAGTTEYFYTDDDDRISLFKKREKSELSDAEEFNQETKKRLAEEMEKIMNLNDLVNELHDEFVRGFDSCKRDSQLIEELAYEALRNHTGYSKVSEKLIEDAGGKKSFAASPEKNLLAAAYASLKTMPSSGKYFRTAWMKGGMQVVEPSEDKLRSCIDELLYRMGYNPSEDEKALQNGTHEAFANAKKIYEDWLEKTEKEEAKENV